MLVDPLSSYSCISTLREAICLSSVQREARVSDDNDIDAPKPRLWQVRLSENAKRFDLQVPSSTNNGSYAQL